MYELGHIMWFPYQVRCLVDHGEFETQDGNIVLLKKNSQVGLLMSNDDPEVWKTFGGQFDIALQIMIQWSLYFKTTHRTKKCGLILQGWS